MEIKLKTYIVLLNWNGWRDTIECLQSIFNLGNDQNDYRVIICDNASEDDSLVRIKQWLDGQLCPLNEYLNDQCRYPYNSIDFPVKYDEFDFHTEIGGKKPDQESAPCSIISINKNLGFAGGCNVGIKYALNYSDCGYVWLLNNDTVLHSEALNHLLDQIKMSDQFGVCGSTLIYYDQPDRIQALGGATYYPCLGISRHLNAHQHFEMNSDLFIQEEKMSYVIGASFFVQSEVFRQVGYLSEDYFLYYEEIDFCTRLKNTYRLTYAPKSIVFHKEGSSIGGSSIRKKKSDTSLYYAVKSRLKFTSKYYRRCYSLVYLVTFIRMFFLLMKFNFHQANLILKILLGRTPKRFSK